jgi:magnesium transporter
VKKANQVLSLLSEDDKNEINRLLKYDQDQAGAWMQTEFFYAFVNDTVADAIARLKEYKKIGELDEVYQVFIVDESFKILGNMKIDMLLIQETNTKFSSILEDLQYTDVSVLATDDIKVVSRKFEEYNLQVIPVLDENDRMIGRITSDDAYDIISDIATEQVYSMAGVDDEVEVEENLKEIIKTRSSWLFINLLTAILASMVISIFDDTLSNVALAILMPIVASMGGNSGTQSLTVVVRQLALGEIELSQGINAIKRELLISLINGVIFAIIISIVAFLWFGNGMLGVVIAIAMIINLLVAGFFGSAIPLLLEKFKIDPAVGSTVLLTTATDIFGFFVFLGLAKIIL